jgi:hypothetical protein
MRCCTDACSAVSAEKENDGCDLPGRVWQSALRAFDILCYQNHLTRLAIRSRIDASAFPSVVISPVHSLPTVAAVQVPLELLDRSGYKWLSNEPNTVLSFFSFPGSLRTKHPLKS